MIIDAHAHLWKTQQGKVDGRDVFSVGNGKSNFGGEIRQMMPPFMTDGRKYRRTLCCKYGLRRRQRCDNYPRGN